MCACPWESRITSLCQTGTLVNTTLWGKQAETFSFKIGDILFLKNVQITNYMGLSLSILKITQIIPLDNFQMPIVQVLRNYNSTANCNSNFQQQDFVNNKNQISSTSGMCDNQKNKRKIYDDDDDYDQ